jgi:hypothetical protein
MRTQRAGENRSGWVVARGGVSDPVLAGDESSFVTGATLMVDAGAHLVTASARRRACAPWTGAGSRGRDGAGTIRVSQYAPPARGGTGGRRPTWSSCSSCSWWGSRSRWPWGRRSSGTRRAACARPRRAAVIFALALSTRRRSSRSPTCASRGSCSASRPATCWPRCSSWPPAARGVGALRASSRRRSWWGTGS